ncbi:MAG: hypothetical protein HKN44_10145 [Ilumatobacter sp.]|nr:hypothetical protein [Ilumatobacter sp.]
MHTMTGRGHQVTRTVRRIAVGAAVVGLVVAGNAAIGVAGDDGRDGSTVPGAPTDAPSPVVDDSNTREGAPAVPAARTRAKVTPLNAGPIDNGRGGVDPATGPNPVPVARATAAPSALPAYDTDDGLAPVDQVSPAKVAADPVVDQDVPGAATASAAGADRPARDADGDS